jgi:hypothetical protein
MRERVVRTARSVVCAVLVPLFFIHQTGTATAQAEAIFARAVHAAQSDARAPYATYDVAVAFANHGRRIVDTWATTEDITHEAILADAFTQEERRAPSVARGSNLVFTFGVQPNSSSAFGAGSAGTPVTLTTSPVNPERTYDPIGPVAFAVDQDFGLTPPRSYLVTHDVASFAANADGLATIGRAGTQLERYRVSLVASDGSIAHLALIPLRDAYHNRLREIWVDLASDAVREAIVAGVGNRAPLEGVRWDVTFARKDGGNYVAEERALEPIDYGRAGRLENVIITFGNLSLTSQSPYANTFGISTPVQTIGDP